MECIYLKTMEHIYMNFESISDNISKNLGHWVIRQLGHFCGREGAEKRNI